MRYFARKKGRSLFSSRQVNPSLLTSISSEFFAAKRMLKKNVPDHQSSLSLSICVSFALLTKRRRSDSRLKPASFNHSRTQTSCSSGVSNVTPEGNTCGGKHMMLPLDVFSSCVERKGWLGFWQNTIIQKIRKIHRKHGPQNCSLKLISGGHADWAKGVGGQAVCSSSGGISNQQQIRQKGTKEQAKSSATKEPAAPVSTNLRLVLEGEKGHHEGDHVGVPAPREEGRPQEGVDRRARHPRQAVRAFVWSFVRSVVQALVTEFSLAVVVGGG